MDYPLKA